MLLLLESEEKNIIGPSIKALRLERNLTQEELSAKLETYAVYINRASISKIESQKRIVTDFELLALAKVLNVNVNLLLGTEVE
ncbi:helix-turn-helix transcriptional regulator [Tissierella creatinini]|nr:helix-turn-helix transcriptional regulator [Tissierella creatinini]TJX63245.1 helix-turn-helix transcriptional regulator [Soehngenia saccharolytica]